MTGVAIHIDTRDLTAIDARFKRLAARVADMTPLMDEIGSMLVASTIDRFENGVDPTGAPWTPSIRALSEGGKTLINSGRLMTSVTHDPGRDAVEVGTNVIYAAIQQAGGRAGRGHAATIPARPYLGLSAGDEREIGHIVDDYLAEAIQ
ncbi:phage virion morphogenesis protein [Varunaivibrio sulfuroxidans]|uniref:Phage virion morphogenesis protein n=1 Tax=Varunaivibrio sulfuroxidans TaxID=1773489 RepID=A0A4R3JBY3_9PROT|nr:phage virion morphogenesis protein [Varunaivibrio sulfuroxidans]TCS62583.1 phage virion morphogenesis protein [Varunaivibrio sulfuroxidans]WES30748.1 phage virion morphogenesis protein [Varunaivibrio sulfuroxidans]